jgi:hypothetical protein
VQATKATIQENEAMSGELRYTAKRAEKLLLQAEKLVAENAALKRELEISKTVCFTPCHPRTPSPRLVSFGLRAVVVLPRAPTWAEVRWAHLEAPWHGGYTRLPECAFFSLRSHNLS